MSKQEIRIVAIPTKKATKGTILENIGVDKTFIISTELEANAFNCVKPTSLWQAIHLYATTDETPKADEYGYSISTNTVELISELQSRVLRAENWRKVVATDDKSLLKNDCDCGATTYEGCSQCLTGIGKISSEFQQAWVREMNNNTPIVDALMEMEEIYHPTAISGGLRPIGEIGGKGLTHFPSSIEYKPKLNPQGYVTILPKAKDVKKLAKEVMMNYLTQGNPEGDFKHSTIGADENINWFIKGYKECLKYNTILPVKEKMHTQTEVENLILQFASDCENDEDLICYDGEIDGVKQYNAAKKWLKQNL